MADFDLDGIRAWMGENSRGDLPAGSVLPRMKFLLEKLEARCMADYSKGYDDGHEAGYQAASQRWESDDGPV